MIDLDKYKHIIFDFDETIATLIMPWGNWINGVRKIYKKYDPSFMSGNVEKIQNEFYKKFGPPIKKEVDELSRKFEAEEVMGIEPVQKTVDLINSTKGKTLLVWSTNDSLTVKRYLADLDILNKFKIIVGRDMVDFVKPEPHGFNKYFKDLGKSHEFLMIGNSHYDRDAAKNSGIDYLDVKKV